MSQERAAPAGLVVVEGLTFRYPPTHPGDEAVVGAGRRDVSGRTGLYARHPRHGRVGQIDALPGAERDRATAHRRHVRRPRRGRRLGHPPPPSRRHGDAGGARLPGTRGEFRRAERRGRSCLRPREPGRSGGGDRAARDADAAPGRHVRSPRRLDGPTLRRSEAAGSDRRRAGDAAGRPRPGRTDGRPRPDRRRRGAGRARRRSSTAARRRSSSSPRMSRRLPSSPIR